MNKVYLLILFILLIIVLYFSLNISETFSQVSLENEVCLYNSYRNLIDSRENNSNSNSTCRDIPYTLNTNCFASKYNSCRSYDFNKVNDNLCKQNAIRECVIENRPIV
jgi:hypothetical protein